jgi:hypothetical protein
MFGDISQHRQKQSGVEATGVVMGVLGTVGTGRQEARQTTKRWQEVERTAAGKDTLVHRRSSEK